MADHLRAVSSAADLPPRWDGVPISWGTWRDTKSSLDFHHKPQACERCGDTRAPLANTGVRSSADGATDVGRATRTRSEVTHLRTPAETVWASVDLRVSRCKGCSLDTVHDTRTEEAWTLDPEDYQPEGSTDTDVLF